MKSTLSVFVSVLIFVGSTHSQDTFSIVAADSATREVGSAGASCVDLFIAGIADPSFIGDVLPDTGAINTQAYYISTNQNNARARMRAGDTPAQIISWLTLNDTGSDSTIRQYGIVGFSGINVNAVGYTGVNCNNYKNHRTGSINGIHYSIQGNILLGQQVIDSMESRFKNTEGDLACRLMAALQGAKMVGADTRCTTDGTSSLFAYVKVAEPSDTYGNPSFSVGVRTHGGSMIEPVDTLQILFNIQHSCVATALNQKITRDFYGIYPNPSGGKVFVSGKNLAFTSQRIEFYSLFGEKIFSSELISGNSEIDLSHCTKGIYFYHILGVDGIIKSGKIILN